MPVAVVFVFGESSATVDRFAIPPQSLDGAAAAAEWQSASAAREALDAAPLDGAPCVSHAHLLGTVWVRAHAFGEPGRHSLTRGSARHSLRDRCSAASSSKAT